MSTQRFMVGSRFRWHTATYEIKKLLSEEKANIEDIDTHQIRTENLRVLVTAWFDGTLRFLVVNRRGKEVIEQPAAPVIDLSDYPPHLKAIADARLAVIEPLLALSPRERTRARVEHRVAEVREQRGATRSGHLLDSISASSVYRWIASYTQSGNDLRSLIPNTKQRGGKGESRLNQEVETIIDVVFRDKYLVRENVTIDDMLREIAVRVEETNRTRPKAEQLVRPSRATVARRIESLDIADRFAAKHGKRAAQRNFKQYGAMDDPTIPLERVEIDHTRADLIVIDDADNLPLGRLTMTYCLDIATCYPLGYYMGFEPPSYLTVMECLHHAICPKGNIRERYSTQHDWTAYGVPSTLVIDNAREFMGNDLRDACQLLGIVLQQTPIQTPYFKPGIERLFGSLNTMLFHTIPGTTFSNLRQRGDYDSVQEACVYLSDVDKMMHLFVVDMYAQQFHRGLNGIPARRWEAATRFGFSPSLPPSAEELRILLGRVTHRTIEHYGIDFESLRYNCNDLLGLRTRLKRQPVKIKYHPGDLSRIYVYDPFDQRYIEVPALAQDYTRGLSLWKHRIIRSAVLAEQDSVDLAALGRARRKIQEIVEDGRERKRTTTRSRVARWDTAGKATRDLDEGTRVVTPTDSSLYALPVPPTPLLPPPPTLSDDILHSASGQQAEDGWELGFDLPRSRRSDHATQEGDEDDCG